jgi:hypothetical protein
MLVGGMLLSFLIVFIFVQKGFININNLLDFSLKIIVINVIATFVESLPLRDWDNITVPGIVVIVGLLLF